MLRDWIYSTVGVVVKNLSICRKSPEHWSSATVKRERERLHSSSSSSSSSSLFSHSLWVFPFKSFFVFQTIIPFFCLSFFSLKLKLIIIIPSFIHLKSRAITTFAGIKKKKKKPKKSTKYKEHQGIKVK